MTNTENKDIDFIKKLTQIIENNLGDDHFGVNDLSNEIGISHSQIHRRLKEIKNQSISQFIKELRLLKAQELLQQKDLTISEIAYNVGFSSPSYFNKCYHEFFGLPPGEYKNNIKNNLTEENNIPGGNKNLRSEFNKVASLNKKLSGNINYLLLFISLILLVLFMSYFFYC